MKYLLITLSVIFFADLSCYANCNCDDWMNRGGYCVDYVKSKIPDFPIPQSEAEINDLKNQDVKEIAAGDVAIFDLGNYWHVAYVERVHLDCWGNPTAIDVSEMNNGGTMSFDEYRSRWKPKRKAEWRRAVCCGVTDGYDQVSVRKNVPLSTVTQVWSPAALTAARETVESPVRDKVRDVFSRLLRFVGRELL